MTVHKDDAGIVFTSTIKDKNDTAINISTYGSGIFTFQKPDNSTINRWGRLYTDGTDGILSYTSQSGDISSHGLWSLQSYVSLSGNTFYSDIYNFRVERNL